MAILYASETELRLHARDLAEDRQAGLIEARLLGTGSSAMLIYKRLQMPGYVYTGMLFSSVRGIELAWTVVAGERGTTGLREAIVTKSLFDKGELTIDGYKQFWAQDPYQPDYDRVDRSVLRFMSDDESYDEQFPDHPLSKVRRVLAAIPNDVQFDPVH
jgi:hypothetical protein